MIARLCLALVFLAACMAADVAYAQGRVPPLFDTLANDPLIDDSLEGQSGEAAPSFDSVESWAENAPSTARLMNDEIRIDRFRKGFYQGAEVSAGFLLDTGNKAGGLDQTFEQARVGFAVPLGSFENILVMQPYFRADHFNGPETIDVPGTVYDTGVTFFNRKVWSPKISSLAIVTPSVRSDFTTNDGAVRLFGLGLVNWQKSDALMCSAGVLYLGRADLPLLPVFGFTYQPSPTWRFEAMMPRPRIAHRLWKQGGEAEGWGFFSASIGGNTWAVTRENGQSDLLTLSEIRLFGGYEVLRPGGRGYVIEAGLALGRKIEYERPLTNVSLNNGVFIQAGWQF